MQLRIFET